MKRLKLNQESEKNKDERIAELEAALADIILDFGPFEVVKSKRPEDKTSQRYSPSARMIHTVTIVKAKSILRKTNYRELLNEY